MKKLFLIMIGIVISFSSIPVFAADLTTVADTFTKVYDWIHGEGLAGLVGKLTTVVGFAAMIAAFTPTPTDDGWVAGARKLLDWFAFNILYAKNAPPKPPKP